MARLSKQEKSSIAKATNIINAGRKNNKMIAVIPRVAQLKSYKITPAQYDFIFQLVPKITISLQSNSSIVLATQLLDRFERLNDKISLEFNIEDHKTGGQFLTMLQMIARKMQTRKVKLYREIYLDCEEMFDTLSSAFSKTVKRLIALSV